MRLVIQFSIQLSLFFLFSFVKAEAQANIPPYPGKTITIDGWEKVSVYRVNNPNNNGTKYTIVSGGLELYEINFRYYKEPADSVMVVFTNKQNFKTNDRHIKFDKRDSKVIVCNYAKNRETISKDSNYAILFSIDRPNNQFITLYQFQPLDDPNTQFILQEIIPDTVLSDHHNAVLVYKRSVQMEEQRNASISNLKKSMLSYKDSVIKAIEYKDSLEQMRTITIEADPQMQQEFSIRMDSVFKNYFAKVFPYSNEEFDVGFLFSCKGNHKIIVDTINIDFKNGPQRNWLRDSFILWIRPQIESRTYNTRTEPRSNPNLKEDFLNRFKEETIKYAAETNDVDLDVRSAFDKYKSYTIDVPTRYIYNFKFKSETKSPKWKYVFNSNGERFVDQTSSSDQKIETTPELQALFKKKIAGSEKIYYLQVCTISVNGQTADQDMRRNPAISPQKY